MKRFKMSLSIVVGIICILGVQSQPSGSIQDLTKPTLQGLDKGVWRHIDVDDLVPEVALPITNKDKNYNVRLHEDIRQSTKEYKISLTLWDANMTTGDSLEIIATNKNGDPIRPCNWTGSSYPRNACEVVDATEIQVMPFGEWINSKATLVATVYFEASTNEECHSKPGMYFCYGDSKCGRPKLPTIFGNEIDFEPIDLITLNRDEHDMHSNSDEDNHKPKLYRCIPRDLICNAKPNCGLGCNADEDSDLCYVRCEDMFANYGYGWYDVQYLLTILLAGLFFILSPICIVIFLFYHRKMNASRVEIERQRAVRVARERTEEYTVSPRNDTPPTYEDFYDIKAPPPSFESVTRSPHDATDESTGNSTAASRDLPQPPSPV